MAKKLSQKDMVLGYLEKGNSITQWECYKLFRATRLGAIIYDLRGEGYNITSEMVTNPDTGTQFARYKLGEVTTPVQLEVEYELR